MDQPGPTSAGAGAPGGGAPSAASRPVPAQRRKAAPRAVPVRSPAFAHLSVPALREYRAALDEEEGKVSYWRRLLQGRLDVVASGSTGARSEHARLGALLTGERVTAGRRALAEVGPVDDIPALPLMSELWERQVVVGDAEGRQGFLQDLDDAERQLSAYRTALHARIAEATGELIARYRESPRLCLTALPSRTGRSELPDRGA
jgi:hypothetical protein